MKGETSQKNSCLYIIFIVGGLVAGFVLYCNHNFPGALKDVQPEEFQSHPPLDMSLSVLRPETLKKARLIHDQNVRKCEDIQVGSQGIAYCVTMDGRIISIYPKNNQTLTLGKVEKGFSYGSRLSRDQKYLYFMNSQFGLCQFDFQTNTVRPLVSTYKGKFLHSLNSIQTHPKNQNILYFTQSTTQIPMYLHTIDILLNRPNGKLYCYDKLTNEVQLLAQGLYFANGVAFQEYHKEQTVLVAESNRFRLIRIWVSGVKKGKKEVAIDKLDLYLDNIKMNEKGQLWIAGPSPRDQLSYFADHHPWVRKIFSRLPYSWFSFLTNTSHFGGVKIAFSQNKEAYRKEYYLWKSMPGFKFATTLYQRDNTMFISSLLSQGVLVIENFDQVEKARAKQLGYESFVQIEKKEEL